MLWKCPKIKHMKISREGNKTRPRKDYIIPAKKLSKCIKKQGVQQISIISKCINAKTHLNLWTHLINKKLGYEYSRQRPIDTTATIRIMKTGRRKPESLKFFSRKSKLVLFCIAIIHKEACNGINPVTIYLNVTSQMESKYTSTNPSNRASRFNWHHLRSNGNQH